MPKATQYDKLLAYIRRVGKRAKQLAIKAQREPDLEKQKELEQAALRLWNTVRNLRQRLANTDDRRR